MPKAKAIGTPMPTQAATMTTKNTIRLPIAHGDQQRLASHSSAAMPPTTPAWPGPKPRAVVVSSRRSSAMIAAMGGADHDGDDAIAVGDLQRDQLDVRLLNLKILGGGQQDLEHENDHHQRGDGGEPAASCPGSANCASVVSRIWPSRRSATTIAKHRQPQEQEVGEFVGPDQRTVEHIARDHAGKQDADLGQHQ